MNDEATLPPPPAGKGRDPWKIFGIITIVLVVVGGAVAVGFFLGSSDDETAVGTVTPVTTTTTTAPPMTTTAAPATAAPATTTPRPTYSTVPREPMPPPVRAMTWQEELLNKWRLQNPRIAESVNGSSEVVYKFNQGYAGLLPGPGSAVDVTATERANLTDNHGIWVHGYIEGMAEFVCDRLEFTGQKASDLTSGVFDKPNLTDEEQTVFARDLVFSQCRENF
jgi:hypothetical protein